MNSIIKNTTIIISIISISIFSAYLFSKNYTTLFPDFEEARLLYAIRFFGASALIIINTLLLFLIIQKNSIKKYLFIFITSLTIGLLTINIGFIKMLLLTSINIIINNFLNTKKANHEN